MKNSRKLPDVGISLGMGLRREFVNDFSEAAKNRGFHVEVEERGVEIFAAVEWILPAAVMLFVTQKFVGTLLQEAAKDAYPVLKRKILEIVKKSIGPERALNPQVISSTPGKVSLEKIPLFAIAAPSANGKMFVRFIFETDLETELHEVAVSEALEMLAKHYSGSFHEEPISQGFDKARDSTTYLAFDRKEKCWSVIDPLKEAREKHARRQTEERTAADLPLAERRREDGRDEE